MAGSDLAGAPPGIVGVLMPTVAGTAEAVTREVARRWAELDPLLPEPPQVAGCGARLAVPEAAGGSLAGAGTCEHWTAPPGSLDATWGAACRFELRPQIAAADVRAALDQLLAQWAGHLFGLPAAAEDDTAAVVTWPSRDIEGVRALLGHGLVPRSVIAARLPGRGPRPRPARPAVRRAHQAGRAGRRPRRGPARPGDHPVRRLFRHRHRAAGHGPGAARRGRGRAGLPGPVDLAGRAGCPAGRPAPRGAA